MAKINITEGELKRIIKESVENIINEAYADHIMEGRNDKYLTARNNYSNYAKKWGSLRAEQQAVYNQQAGGGWTGEARYNDARDKAARKLRRTTRRNGQQFKQELDNTKNEYAKSRDEVNKLSYNNQLLQNQINTLTSDKQQLSTELAQLHNAIGSRGNMQTALKTINQWKKNSVELTNLQKTSQQQAATIQQQQANAQKTQQGHMQANQTRVAQNKLGNLPKVQPPTAMQPNNGLVK